MASSLGEFLSTMYKKRELEYNAAYNQYKAKVAAAESIGQGIGAIGKGIGDTLGSYMSARQTNAMGGIANQLGEQQFGSDWKGGGGYEMGLRAQMGQFKDTAMTPYQQAMVAQGQRNSALGEARENRITAENLGKKADAAQASATKGYRGTEADYRAYQAGSDKDMHTMMTTDNPDEFYQAQQAQIARTQAGFSSGLFQGDFKPIEIPKKYIPKASPEAQEATPGYQRYGKPQYLPGVGQDINRTTTGIPQGAIPAPNFPREAIGTEIAIGGRPYVWKGNWFEPK